MFLSDLAGQFPPAHSIGQVPRGSLSRMLIDSSGAYKFAQGDHFGVFGEGLDRSDFVLHARIRLGLAVFQANGHNFDFADLFGTDVEHAAAAAATEAAAATTLSAAAEAAAAAADALTAATAATKTTTTATKTTTTELGEHWYAGKGVRQFD